MTIGEAITPGNYELANGCRVLVFLDGYGEFRKNNNHEWYFPPSLRLTSKSEGSDSYDYIVDQYPQLDCRETGFGFTIRLDLQGRPVDVVKYFSDRNGCDPDNPYFNREIVTSCIY